MDKEGNTMEQIRRECTPEVMVSGMRRILTRRWPEANALLDQMLAKGQTDQEYGNMLTDYLSNRGSTLMLRELAQPFGQYLIAGEEGRNFRNQVNAVDAAHCSVAIGQELSIEQQITQERLTILQQAVLTGKPLKLLSKMVQKAEQDLQYDLALERYILSGGDMDALKALTEEFGDAGGQRTEDRAFRKALQAIDEGLNDVWAGRIEISDTVSTILKVLVITDKKIGPDWFGQMVSGKPVNAAPYDERESAGHAHWVTAAPDTLAEISANLANVDRPSTRALHAMIPEQVWPEYLAYKRAFAAAIRADIDTVSDHRPELAMLAFREEASSVDIAPLWMADHALADYLRRGESPERAAWLIGRNWTLDELMYRPYSAEELVRAGAEGTMKCGTAEGVARDVQCGM